MNVLNREYDLQAERFLRKTNTEFSARFLYSGSYFEDDQENRDIYEITFKQTPKSGAAPRKWSFKFGQSIIYSREYVKKAARQREDRGESYMSIRKYKCDAIKKPRAYEVLSSIAKNDPGTFSDFCSEMGYDEDSRKAEKTYFAVQEEYKNCLLMFGAWMKSLQEIQ